MFLNYCKSALRNILKSKFFSFINIFGLSLGVAGMLLIFQFVRFESSYDSFHPRSDRTYRITYSKEKEGEQVFNTVLVYAGVGSLMKQAFPEIEDFTRLRSFVIGGISKAPVRYQEMIFEEQRVYYADSNFFNVFPYPVLKGDPGKMLQDQFTVAISESTARKYFGKDEPLGKSLRIGQKFEFTVTGVFKDIPENAHAKFDFLISHSTMRAVMPPWWNDDNMQLFHGHLYVVLKPGTNPKALASKFSRFVDDYVNGEQLRKMGVELKYAIMPLTDIHLNSHVQHEAEQNGDERVVTYLSVIGILILIIAWINYVNLSTSKALERAREVGIRKVVGAFRTHLIVQFFFESVLINFASLLVALVMIYLGQNLFDAVGAQGLKSVNIWMDPLFWAMVAVVFIFGILLSGFYPALVLSSFRPVSVLKGKFINSKGGALLRKILVVLQFAASIALIICTVTIYRQVEYMRSRDLGFTIDHTLVIKAPIVFDSLFRNKSLSFKHELLQLTSVKGVTVSNNVPGNEPDGASWYLKVGGNEDDVQFCYQAWVDDDYLNDYGIRLLAGRNFVENGLADSTSVLLNEACLSLFDFKNPEDALGQRLDMGEVRYTIVGVINNFHQQSSKKQYAPIIFNYFPQVRGFYSIKLNSGNMQEQVQAVEASWKRVFPENPFIFFFLNDEFDKQYKSDLQFGRLLAFFSAMTIAIGCLGLLGLSAFMLSKRTKEIGIRKILGSSVNQIMLLVSKEFVILILLANLIAWPVSAYLMNRWLNNFAFHIDLDVSIFVFSGAVTLLVSLFTILVHVIRAASANPIQSIRTD
jgi:putative ABC transport system permease protein